MKAIIIYWEKSEGELIGHIEGGIYNGITYRAAVEAIGENNIVFYIPLRVSGFNYQDRKNTLEYLAKTWQESNTEFCSWSYGELATIQNFFESQGKKYGLTKIFRDNGII